MEINAITNSAKELKDAINKKIKDGELKTWEIVRNKDQEVLYSHIPEQWNQKAMVKPFIGKQKLTLAIRWWKHEKSNEATSGYILGRFTEILMVHFKEHFQYLEIKK